jgi:uncharacterized protein (DUF2235 family)
MSSPSLPAGRKIVMCFDGTGNEISKPHTHVYRMFQATEGTTDLRFYHAGVNTLVDPDRLYKVQKFPRWIKDSASGYSIRLAFTAAYEFLIDNLQENDELYLFGFSRGAFAARMFAAAVRMFGVPRPEHRSVVPYIWQAYIGTALRPGGGKNEEVFPYAGRIKRDFGRKVNFRFRFMGIWDTVSSFGSIYAFKSLPYTRNNKQIEVIRHAMAVDEKRGVFRINRIDTSNPALDRQEVWFAGYHSDVGGGAPLAENGLGMVSWDWMTSEAAKHGLVLNQKVLIKLAKDCPTSHKGPDHNSMDLMYRFVDLIPTRRYEVDTDEVPTSPTDPTPKTVVTFKGMRWQTPNFGRAREIGAGDTVHPSVHDRIRDVDGYRPKNVK